MLHAMKFCPLTRLEMVTVLLTAVILSPEFGNPLADILGCWVIGIGLMLMVVWMKHGNPLG